MRDEVARQAADLADANLTEATKRKASAGMSEEALAAIGKIWERRKDEIIGKISVLEEAAASFLEGDVDVECRHTAEREAHKLAGSLGTFGFSEGSRLARALEQNLAGNDDFGEGQKADISKLAASLRRTMEQTAGRDSPTDEKEEPEDDSPHILAVGNNPDLVERIGPEAVARGMRLTTAHHAAEARSAVAAQRPDVVLLDLENIGEAVDGLDLLEELSGRTPPLPVLVLTESDALTDRVDVAQRGGSGFLNKALPSSQMIEAVAQMLARLSDAETKVLAVDDDPSILGALKALLEPQGLRLKAVETPLEFWAAMEESSPDLVILDVEMPQVSGIELCRVLRSDPRWTGLPVIFLTAHVDSDTVQEIFNSGADDYISKPLVGAELISRISNRLERIRLYRRMAETDPLTGTANRRKSTQVLQQLERLSDRYSQPFCLAVIDLDNFKKVNDTYGHGAGDDVLRGLASHLLRAFRGEDVVARWGGEEFAVGMYGMSRGNGVQRLAELLESFREERFVGPDQEDFGVTFSTGVAQYPEDGANLQSLYRAADDALYHAKEAGRNCVLPAGWYSHIEEAGWSDVVVVADDETLSGAIADGLRTRGYKTRVISQADEAAEALEECIPGLKVIVLDLSLGAPDLKGVGLLKHLAERRWLRGARVIVLGERTAEAELLEALELGAFHHVLKPLSVRALMHRIQAAVEG
ncbi:MAG: response regulator [Actinomycetota bacterium]|nr:response regulator [Actinomycetota bacterium]